MENCTLKTIAYLYNDFGSKFGLPRQSGLSEHISVIEFLPEYRNAEAVRGLEEFSHIWILWHFSKAERETWSPTVRPPRLGGNRRMGVFATRSPYRPNGIGMSSVRLEKIEFDKKRGPLLYVIGADAANGTPILDIKPYLAFTDSHPEAVGGFSDAQRKYALRVAMEESLENRIPSEHRKTIFDILSQDPRPAYQRGTEREYGFVYAGLDIRFTVKEDTAYVTSIEKLKEES